jgi:alanyl-tRNA synthetase
MASLKEIRAQFLEYFRRHGHDIVPSSPLVPQNDPTLLFTNAGMVPFKNLFTGVESRPYSRAASAQKCVRAGGKHNDLDNVGYTSRHHTFFEMLGNFSFGDYFKEEAIVRAWELVIKVFAVDKSRLTVTVYAEDEEAYRIWQKVAGLPTERLVRIGTSDNFWSMGDTGPCGPCSELFYDHGAHLPGGPPGSAEQDGERFVEIWNLVFMQFDQAADGSRTLLPKPSIDTGMGLERIAAVLQGTHDNYEVDALRRLIEASAEASNVSPDGETAVSHRVIADHLRATSFLIADGVLPSNEGRGYVLRRIMRRAMRHAHMLGTNEPLMHRLVPALVAEMGGAYPELVRAQALIGETLKLEETRFRQTLERGLKLLEEETARLAAPGGPKTLPGEVAFKLYDTYGFPLDLTEDVLRSQEIGVDVDGFNVAMARQKSDARAAWKGSGATATSDIWFDLRERVGPTEFVGYVTDMTEGKVVALLKDGQEVPELRAGEKGELVANQTPFYGESGGQVGDEGDISGRQLHAHVTGTSKQVGDMHIHHVAIEKGRIVLGDIVELRVDAARRNATRANHSATHLLHEALRRVLGPHVAQKGSLVSPERLRFDFAHSKPLTEEEVAAVEAQVNSIIRRNSEVQTRLMRQNEAIKAGALALFGEKYGDEVRVLFMGDGTNTPFSVELCGGTHVGRLGDIGLFKIVGESAVASGVRRLEALTGEAARLYLSEQESFARRAAEALKTTSSELTSRVVQLLDERKRLERELTEMRRKMALAGDVSGSSGETDNAVQEIGGVKLLGRVFADVPAKELRSMVDDAKKKLGSGVVAFVTTEGGKASLAVGVTADLTNRYDAVELVRQGAAELGGQGGGGRRDMAQAGGPDGSGAQAALDAIAKSITGLAGVA